MSLNIRNDETCHLAGEPAHLTGETKTGASTVALREGQDRECRIRGAPQRLRDMRTIAERCAHLLGPGPSAIEHGDALLEGIGIALAPVTVEQLQATRRSVSATASPSRLRRRRVSCCSSQAAALPTEGAAGA